MARYYKWDLLKGGYCDLHCGWFGTILIFSEDQYFGMKLGSFALCLTCLLREEIALSDLSWTKWKIMSRLTCNPLYKHYKFIELELVNETWHSFTVFFFFFWRIIIWFFWFGLLFLCYPYMLPYLSVTSFRWDKW